MAAGVFLFEHVFWSQYEGEESPVTSIPETDAKEAGLTKGGDTNREGEGPEGLKLGQPSLFSFTAVSRPSLESPRWSGAIVFPGLMLEERIGDQRVTPALKRAHILNTRSGRLQKNACVAYSQRAEGLGLPKVSTLHVCENVYNPVWCHKRQLSRPPPSSKSAGDPRVSSELEFV